jgi:hypothetical protein
MKCPVDLKDRPLSYSSLKNFRKSPKHYVHYVTKPRRPPSEAMIIGSAFEMLLIEPEKFKTDIFIYQKPNLRSNAGKEEWEKIKVAGQGKLMITEEIEKKVKLMVENAKACDEMMQYVNSITKYQTKLTWTDKKTGIPFIGYSDAEGNAFGEDWVFEIKTTNDADPDQFVRAFYQWDYHIQIASYAEGYHKTRYRFPNFAVLVFDTSEPYNCAPMMVENKTLEEAKEEWRASVDAFKFCMDEELFHQGFEFRLQTMPYFPLRKVGYYKRKF